MRCNFAARRVSEEGSYERDGFEVLGDVHLAPSGVVCNAQPNIKRTSIEAYAELCLEGNDSLRGGADLSAENLFLVTENT